MQVRNIPVNLVDPTTNEPLLNYTANVPQQNFSQALPLDAMRKASEMPIMNTKEAAHSAMLSAMPILSQGFTAGSTKGYQMAMPIIEKLAGGQVAAAEQQANIANEQTKRQQMMMLYDEMGKAENAKNFGILDSQLKALTGATVNPAYAGLTFTDPTSELKMAAGAAGQQMSANMQKYTTDQHTALGYAGLAARAGAKEPGMDLNTANSAFGHYDKFIETLTAQISTVPLEQREKFLADRMPQLKTIVGLGQGMLNQRASNDLQYLKANLNNY